MEPELNPVLIVSGSAASTSGSDTTDGSSQVHLSIRFEDDSIQFNTFLFALCFNTYTCQKERSFCSGNGMFKNNKEYVY